MQPLPIARSSECHRHVESLNSWDKRSGSLEALDFASVQKHGQRKGPEPLGASLTSSETSSFALPICEPSGVTMPLNAWPNADFPFQTEQYFPPEEKRCSSQDIVTLSLIQAGTSQRLRCAAEELL